MRIGIYSPYWQTMGGGERYLLNIAYNLSKKHEVYLLSNETPEKASIMFGIELEKIHFSPEELIRTKSLFKRLIDLRQFNMLFYMTDGGLFFSPCRKNFLIIQSPSHVPSKTILNKIKLLNWKIICYSQFMRKIILREMSIDPIILSPAIDINLFKTKYSNKKNIILSVGRFFPHLHSKKHDFLIDFFIKNRNIFKDWKLIIAGGLSDKNGKQIVDQLMQKSLNNPIEIRINLTFPELISLYKQAKLYWHAAGFGENLDKYPEKAEHFGITTLEAMAGGAVPLVFNAGGQQDIVIGGQTGYLWENTKEFLEENKKLLKSKELLEKISKSAMEHAEDFSQNKFYEKLEKIISG